MSKNEQSVNQIVGENIAKYRKQMDMTQVELAEHLNYSDKAVSKWERGESIPDIDVLLQICDIFSISMNDLCYQKKVETANQIISSKKLKHTYVILLSVGLCWLVATIVFTLLLIFANGLEGKWLAFIYAIPISGIVLVVLNSKWGKRFWNTIYVSIVVWGTLLSICLTINSPSINWLYLIGIPLEILTIIWFLFKSKIIEKIHNIRIYKKRK